MTRPPRALALALGLLAAACGGSSTDATLRQRQLSQTLPRAPTIVRALAFDYAALPALEPVPLTGDLEGTSWVLERKGEGWELHMAGRLVADIQAGGGRFFRAIDDEGLHAVTAAPGAERVCDPRVGTSRAVWQGYVDRGRTRETIEYVCFAGDYDQERCSARADRAWRVVAPQVAPGPLYGFRVENGVCDAVALEHGERLEVVGPRPLWVASTSSEPGLELDRSFARALVPVSRGSSASVVLDVSGADVRRFSGGREARDTDDLLMSLSVEIVWPRAEGSPSATGFAARLFGSEATTRSGRAPREDVFTFE